MCNKYFTKGRDRNERESGGRSAAWDIRWFMTWHILFSSSLSLGTMYGVGSPLDLDSLSLSLSLSSHTPCICELTFPHVSNRTLTFKFSEYGIFCDQIPHLFEAKITKIKIVYIYACLAWSQSRSSPMHCGLSSRFFQDFKYPSSLQE